MLLLLMARYNNNVTYVILGQVRVIGLNAVVQNRDHDPFAGVALFPRRDYVHVEALQRAAVLVR